MELVADVAEDFAIVAAAEQESSAVDKVSNEPATDDEESEGELLNSTADKDVNGNINDINDDEVDSGAETKFSSSNEGSEDGIILEGIPILN